MLGVDQKLFWRKESGSPAREQVQEELAGHPWINSWSAYYQALLGGQRM